MKPYALNLEKPEDENSSGKPALIETATFPAVGKPPEIRREEIIHITEAEAAEAAESSAPGKKKRAKRAVDPEKAKKREKLSRVWSKISPPLALLIALLIAAGAIFYGVKYIDRRFFKPVDASDPTPIVVEIPKGSGASAIAKILYEAGGEGEKGLINNKSVFKVYVDFLGKSSSLKAGTYVLSRNMGIKQIVDIICTGNPPRATVKFTISEGSTVEAVARKLVEQGILPSPDRFLELCTDAKSFADKYWFVKNIVDEGREGRTYMLEGYLFPDTYEVYADATEEEVIVKMLDRFNEIYSRRYVERAEEVGLTLDEVVILASMIEKEAKT
ncbi:MAG: endolytic transglycosylase MltG, partial [Clostridia bacterium]|nr:endolytic transglycosylase MltG [Clostridia bacterium]